MAFTPLRPQKQKFAIVGTASSVRLLIHPLFITLGLCSGFTIPASADITSGGDGTIVSPASGAPNTIEIKGGTPSASGTNLFHSFGKFDLNSGQTANFQPGANVQNILGRINSGQPSSIDGTIQVNGGTSSNVVNLYLMNPAGIVFGKNAILDINGAFTATTARAIGFDNGQWFNALGTNNYDALTGNPIGLAFTNDKPGSIFNAANLTTTPGKSITLVGGTVISTGDIKTAGGNISIATVKDGKYVEIKADGSILKLELPTSAVNIAKEAKEFTALSLPALLTNTGVDLAATGVKNENGMVTLVGTPAAIKAAADRDKAQAVYDASPQSFSDFETLTASKNAFEAVNTVGNPITIADDINLGDTISKPNRPISSGDIITKNLDASVKKDLNINLDPSVKDLNGGNIHFDSSQVILTGKVDTSSTNYIAKDGGTLVLNAQTEIKTGVIDTYARSTVSNKEIGFQGGNLTLSTQTGDIIVDSIDTSVFSSDVFNEQIKDRRQHGGDITVNAKGLFRVIASNQSLRSIQAQQFGIIKIAHGGTAFVTGGDEESLPDFFVGKFVEGLRPKLKLIEGFKFGAKESGARGFIVTSLLTNGSTAVIYTNSRGFYDFSDKKVAPNGSSITAVPRITPPENPPENLPENPKNNPDEQAAKQKSKQDCTPSSTSVAANSTTDPNRAEGNASAPSAAPCQLVTGTAGGTLQILNNRE
jgi:filamentous hemagglutinin family protein